jgi:hypothetical protein
LNEASVLSSYGLQTLSVPHAVPRPHPGPGAYHWSVL